MPVLSLLRTGCILLVLSLIGCQAPDYRHRSLPIVDEPNRHLSGILVVPLYLESGGIAMGPDAKGLSTPDTPVVMAPFVFTSGDDILTNKIPARGLVVLVPILYIGEFKSVHRWLLLKKGYSRLVIDENVIWGKRPIEMTPSAIDEVTPCIDLLLAAKPDQGALKTMMDAPGITASIAVRLDAKDKALLRKYGSAP